QGRGRLGRVEGPNSSAVRRSVDLVSESSAMRATSSLVDECRRLGERLRLDAVGVAAGPQGQVTWWAAPDGPPLPSRLDDVLFGTLPGWLVLPVGSDAMVFA